MANITNTGRINFSSIKTVIDYPDFLDVQLQSFLDFFQLETPAEKRSQEGLFKVFSENMKDEELSKFYRDLMVSEANHYTLFLGYARKYMDREIVDRKWQDLLAFEANMMKTRGTVAKVHG